MRFTDARCMLVVGAGGGGDVVSAYLLAKALEQVGYRTVVASLVWERFVRDPEPGPIPIRELKGMVELGDWSGVSLGPCYAIRRGVIVEPAACRLSRLSSEPVGLLDAYGGELAVRLGLLELASLNGCDAVLAVDVGGDILAVGCEPGLWSPLADSITLAATALTGLEAYVVVYAPGADGELAQDEVVDRAGSLYRSFVTVLGLPARLLRSYAWLVKGVGTEAGSVPLTFIEKGPGVRMIRGGSRWVYVNPFTTAAIVLEARGVYGASPLAKAVTGSTSILEASQRLNELRVFTELNLEEGIALLRGLGLDPTPQLLTRIREEGRRLLGWKPCSRSAVQGD